MTAVLAEFKTVLIFEPSADIDVVNALRAFEPKFFARPAALFPTFLILDVILFATLLNKALDFVLNLFIFFVIEF